jgi:hypothetical protein
MYNIVYKAELNPHSKGMVDEMSNILKIPLSSQTIPKIHWFSNVLPEKTIWILQLLRSVDGPYICIIRKCIKKGLNNLP